jgi:hypothetical protein
MLRELRHPWSRDGLGVVRLISLVLWLGAAIGFVLIANADAEGRGPGMVLLASASVALGLATRSWAAAAVSLLLVPLALPFGYPNDYSLPDPLPVWFSAAIWTPLSAILILVGAWIGELLARRGRQTPAPVRTNFPPD